MGGYFFGRFGYVMTVMVIFLSFSFFLLPMFYIFRGTNSMNNEPGFKTCTITKIKVEKIGMCVTSCLLKIYQSQTTLIILQPEKLQRLHISVHKRTHKNSKWFKLSVDNRTITLLITNYLNFIEQICKSVFKFLNVIKDNKHTTGKVFFYFLFSVSHCLLSHERDARIA